MVSVIASNVRICCNRAVYDAPASVVSHNVHRFQDDLIFGKLLGRSHTLQHLLFSVLGMISVRVH